MRCVKEKPQPACQLAQVIQTQLILRRKDRGSYGRILSQGGNKYQSLLHTHAGRVRREDR
jgi:hypothetical protein